MNFDRDAALVDADVDHVHVVDRGAVEDGGQRVTALVGAALSAGDDALVIVACGSYVHTILVVGRLEWRLLAWMRVDQAEKDAGCCTACCLERHPVAPVAFAQWYFVVSEPGLVASAP